jgi:hypothetical protein
MGRLRRNASAARRGARKTSTPPLPLPHSGEHTRSRRHQGNNERRGGGRGASRATTQTHSVDARAIDTASSATAATERSLRQGTTSARGRRGPPRSTQSAGPPGGRDGGASGRPPGGRRGTPPNATPNAPLQGGGGRPAPAARRGPARTCDHPPRPKYDSPPSCRKKRWAEFKAQSSPSPSSSLEAAAAAAVTPSYSPQRSRGDCHRRCRGNRVHRAVPLPHRSVGRGVHATEGRRPHEARAGG